MGALGRLIQEHFDRQLYVPSRRDFARAVDVSPQTVTNWFDGDGGMPKPENLRRLAQVTGEPYTRVLDAALVDAGYLPKELDSEPPTTTQPAAPERKASRVRSRSPQREPRSSASRPPTGDLRS